MYRMQSRKKDIRIYVRNKARYNPETKERDFLFVDINDFAGTTIGDIKENVRRQCRNTVKIDDLFLNNVSLADDRSVAHYNLEDGSILESTSNPLWVSCLYIKALEVRQQQEGNPCDEEVQKWTSKSLPKKYTLIGVLLNSNNAYLSQPPHFPTLVDFVQYLERLGRKSATMHPNYTQRDLAIMEQDFHRDFENKYDDPIAAFIDHHAVRLGILSPDEAERKLRQPADVPMNRSSATKSVAGREGPPLYPGSSGAATPGTGRGRPTPAGGSSLNKNARKQMQVCEDCETSLAVVYCTDCQNAADGLGVSFCKRCSDLLHTGATRRRHNIIDISQAPKTSSSKPYVPRAFLAPFSILLAMYSALLDHIPKLSMTEEEIKIRAQSLTDTDLQDKQTGKYVGGFDCMENCLMNKGLVKKEAAREPTYALTDFGHTLGEKLYLFYKTLFTYLASCQLPKLPDTISTTCVGNRKICLLIDENERDKGRLLKYAADKGIDAQTRFLPAGDYIWILTPPMVDTRQQYTGNHTDTEVVLPFIVERKSWEDFEHSVNSTRFQRQVNNMMGSGVKNCFYLMEGSPGALRYNATQQHQQHLKAMVEKLIYDYGFYVNYTSSWMKSAQWLLWFTQLIVEAFKEGKLTDSTISYRGYSSRVAQLNGAHPGNLHASQVRRTHNWAAQLFIDHIFRDELGDRALLRTVHEDLGIQKEELHLLVIQGLEQYNKKRQSTLNKCCTAVHDTPQQAKETVERMIGSNIHNMVHYDVTCYKQLYIQVMAGVCILRTESEGESERVQQQFLSGPQSVLHQPGSGRNRPTKQPVKKPKSPRITSPYSRDVTTAIDSITNALHTNTDTVHPLDFCTNLLNQIGGDSPSLPPGCHISNPSAPRQKLPGISGTELPHSFKPFSGSGFTLGTGSNSRTRPSATVTREDEILESESSGYGNRTRSDVGMSGFASHPTQALDSHFGLLGPNLDNSNMTPNATSVAAGEDYANSQNELQILQEVLNKSKHDVGTAESDSQDDPELQLALMLSKQTDNVNPSLDIDDPVRFDHEKSVQFTDKVVPDDSQEDLDEELKIAIERSKLDSNQTGKSDLDTHTISKLQKDINGDVDLSGMSPKQMKTPSVNVDILPDEDKQLKLAIEMSKIMSTPVKIDEEETDFQMREALERSKLDHTPRKLIDDSDFQLKLAIERSKIEYSPKKSDTELENKILKVAIERSIIEQSPKTTSIKRKLDNSNDYVERRKLVRSLESKLEENMDRVANTDGFNEELVIDISDSQNSIIQTKEVASLHDEVIQIDSQSQEIDIEEKELESSSDFTGVKPVSVNTFSDVTSYATENDDISRKVKDCNFLFNSDERVNNSADEFVNSNVDEEVDDDLIPPSPCKDKLNASQLSISFKSSSMKGEDTLHSVASGGPKRCKSVLSKSVTLGIEIPTKILHTQHDRTAEVPDSSSKEKCDQEFCVKKEAKLSKNSDFSLKSSLFRFVDENASDDDDSFSDCDDNDNPMDYDGSENNSSRSIEDIFHSDVTGVKSSHVPETNTNSDKVPKTNENVPNLPTSGILVSKHSEQHIQTFCIKESNQTRKSVKQRDSKMDKTANVDSSRTNNTEVSAILTVEEHSNIKLEPGDENPYHTDSNLGPGYNDEKVLNINSKDINSTLVKTEPDDSQTDNSGFYGFDSDMEEVDFNPDLDDSDNDPLYEVTKDDVASTESSNSDCSAADKDDMDELISRVDPDYLPNISRPKKRRKTKKDCSRSSRVPSYSIHIKTEKSENSVVDTEMDAVLAQMLQRELNKESHDELLAGKIHAGLSASALVHETDEEVARRLHTELNSTNSSTADELINSKDAIFGYENKVLESKKEQYCKKKQGNMEHIDLLETDNLVKELQRREMEKIERMKRTLAEDKRLAELLQENPDVEKDEREKKETTVPRNYKKLFAEDRALREKAAAEVEEYRKLQSQRYHQRHSQKLPSERLHTVEKDFRGSSIIGSSSRNTVETDNTFDNIMFDRQSSLPSSTWPSTDSIHIKTIQSQNNSLPFSQSRPGPLTPCTKSNQLLDNELPIDQSQAVPLTPCGQSKSRAERNVNTTCGSCGEKGHTRVNPSCPKYHTAEESARREAQQERKRQQKEEKKREELENINMLARHQQVIEDMNNELQREISTIQNNLRTRAVELETQVNSRVKKMENAEKRKKKK